MTKKEINEMAEKMEVDNGWALDCRIEFLNNKINKELEYQYNLNEIIYKKENGITRDFLQQAVNTSKKRFSRYEKEIKRLTAKPSNDPLQITDDDVEAARSYPIDMVVDFNGGRCKAFCHEGDNMTMSHYKKANKVHCFKCDKSFSALDVLIERDGYSFVNAVRELR